MFWLVGITNAINLLDNMDGLAGGVALIASAFLGYLSFRSGDLDLLYMTIALCGSILGFLVFNFPPAKIFMGNSGSLFLGFTLAELAVAKRTTASNVLAVFGSPLLIFMLPILDTTLVTITRLLRGQSPAQGGKDHTSHRLVYFGLGERQVVLILYCVALFSGGAGIALEAFDYDSSLALVPLVVIGLTLLTAYLGRIRIVTAPDKPTIGSSQNVMEHAFRSHVFELILDLALVGVGYYLAFWVRYGFDMTATSVDLYLRSWPFALLAAYSVSYVAGVYKSIWKFYNAFDLLRQIITALGTAVMAYMLARLLYPDLVFPIGVYILFALFYFLGLAGSRASFAILDQLLMPISAGKTQVKVLLYDASLSSENLLRWLALSPNQDYQVVGIIDENSQQWGRTLRGIEILGGLSQLAELTTRSGVKGILVSEARLLEDEKGQLLLAASRQAGLWVRAARMELEIIEEKQTG